MSNKRWWRRSVMVVAVSVAAAMVWSAVALGAARKRIVWQVHWSDFQIEGIYKDKELVAKGLRQYVQEYQKSHPDVEIELQSVPMEEYLNKLLVAQAAGTGPDIISVLNTWGPQLVQDGVLDPVPADLVKDVKANYIPVAVQGATVDGEIWGIPFEVGNYALVYNKKHLQEAGFGAPPKVWSELVDMGAKLTKRSKDKTIERYGFAFLAGWESAVVHPYLGLLWSCGGEFLAPDFKKAMFNSPQGVQALEAELDLFRKGATDVSGSVWEFPQGRVSTMIMASWYESTLVQSFGKEYEATVGVAPVPELCGKSINAAYSWWLGVNASSRVRKEAWDFIRWFAAQPLKNGTTLMGTYQATNIGSIPPRKGDLNGHPAQLNDLYTRVFVQELAHARHEPNVLQGAEIKSVLWHEIVEAWHGRKTSQQALGDAAGKIDGILKELY
ncbi:MAG: ABC transporter substrate-binding protein [Limnochordaceae bacterium]|nr:ABC transporter substrate-binding protein [Limnochordaceae bacterium]